MERQAGRNKISSSVLSERTENMALDLNYKADVVVNTDVLTREDWLRYRRTGLGGSDAAAIMGVSPFCTKRDLYYDKRGITSAMDEEESNWVAKEV